MAKHKAPIQVSIVTEEKSKFAEFVERWTVPFFIGAAVVTAGILWRANASQKAERSTGSEWHAIHEADRDNDLEKSKAALAAAEGTPIEAYVRMSHARIARANNDREAAKASLDALAAGDHPVLNGIEFPIGEGGAPISLADR